MCLLKYGKYRNKRLKAQSGGKHRRPRIPLHDLHDSNRADDGKYRASQPEPEAPEQNQPYRLKYKRKDNQQIP